MLKNRRTILFIIILIILIFVLLFINTANPNLINFKNIGNLFSEKSMTNLSIIGAIIVGIVGITQMNKRIDRTDKQIALTDKQNQNSRFSSSIELLGSESESARIGGAYSLYFLARENHKEYAEVVCEILCAHIRTIASKEEYNKEYKEKYRYKSSNEIQTIINLLFKKQEDSNLIFTKLN